nr:MAG TPA: hypothetical protein [Caudoviricetes sp.]
MALHGAVRDGSSPFGANNCGGIAIKSGRSVRYG